ncbi:unnamed protein product [Haemonchus placei]|uniref:Uncharacterized protein n=1 Tax=Haemonchus placei TaxID=6290 RepID=A0A158QL67_HAEPC|nr:unnamed protein product [Haemonchus placei]
MEDDRKPLSRAKMSLTDYFIVTALYLVDAMEWSQQTRTPQVMTDQQYGFHEFVPSSSNLPSAEGHLQRVCSTQPSSSGSTSVAEPPLEVHEAQSTSTETTSVMGAEDVSKPVPGITSVWSGQTDQECFPMERLKEDQKFADTQGRRSEGWCK